MKIIEIGSCAVGGVTEYTKELVNSLVSLGIDVSHFYISPEHKEFNKFVGEGGCESG